jgi:tetratricopeptide (TPR) repeat protein
MRYRDAPSDDRESIAQSMPSPTDRPQTTSTRASPPERKRVFVAEARTTAALNAQRAGTLRELVRQHDPVVRRYLPHALQPVLATAGDRLAHEHRHADAVALWLRWAVTHLCPDPPAHFEDIDRAAWLDRTSWRPALAAACHHGMATVPDFRDRYRRRADEAASDNLCGLWGVGPSTYYRYLDKAKRQIALMLLGDRKSPESTMSVRAFVHEHVLRLHAFATEQERDEWHRAQAQACQTLRDPVSALWHFLHAGDPSAFVGLLHRHRAELARKPETRELIDRLSRLALPARQRFDLLLAQAGLARQRGDEDDEQQLYSAALRLATHSDDKLMLGEVYGALGKFHEFRDADRAFACYEDSARFLNLTSADEGGVRTPQFIELYVHTLVRLAWLYVSRNDPRSRAVLEQAQALHDQHNLSDEVVGMLEQTRGEYWRRTGELRRALECKHRALNLFERIGDQRSVLVTYFNLSLIYGEARDFDRAVDYGRRVLASAEKVALEPETLVNTHGNLGVAYFWQGNYDEAIHEYQLAVDVCQKTGLKTPLSTAHYNLAEAFYKRFQLARDPEDERRGDMHATISMRASPSAKDQSHIEATRKLKSDILGASSESPSYDRLLPEEFAAHFEQMLQVQQHRSALALPSVPAAHARARLAIARAYLTIATKERETALALVHKHDLGDQFTAEFEELRSTFNRQLTREEHLTAQWKQAAADMLNDERRAVLLSELLRSGSVNKSGYANVCGLGLATASKHLGMLTDRGLLVQSGRGPSTRYGLPIE